MIKTVFASIVLSGFIASTAGAAETQKAQSNLSKLEAKPVATKTAVMEKRKDTQFYKGHTHDNGETHGGPQHSGGTDKWGCHNASVPYHCH